MAVNALGERNLLLAREHYNEIPVLIAALRRDP
jgi:hypothetical protein